jgi:hypothetical protein
MRLAARLERESVIARTATARAAAKVWTPTRARKSVVSRHGIMPPPLSAKKFAACRAQLPCDRSRRRCAARGHSNLIRNAGEIMIRKLKSGQYRLYSRKKNPKTGKRRNLGTFATRAAAEKHERAVQYFKRGGR